VVELLAQRWLAGLVSSAKRGKHQPKLSITPPASDVDAFLAAGHAEGWEALRNVTARGEVPSNIAPETAAWMDAGIFARSSIGELPPLGDLVKQAGRRTDAEGRQRIDECLRRWNLLDQCAA
jgi:hypothetical protein